jgi:hypothetical protein
LGLAILLQYRTLLEFINSRGKVPGSVYVVLL